MAHYSDSDPDLDPAPDPYEPYPYYREMVDEANRDPVLLDFSLPLPVFTEKSPLSYPPPTTSSSLGVPTSDSTTDAGSHPIPSPDEEAEGPPRRRTKSVMDLEDILPVLRQTEDLPQGKRDFKWKELSEVNKLNYEASQEQVERMDEEHYNKYIESIKNRRRYVRTIRRKGVKREEKQREGKPKSGDT